MDIPRRGKLDALAEVLLVLMADICALALVSCSAVGEWERKLTPWPIAERLAMAAVPVLWLLLTRRKLADYGLTTKALSWQFEATVKCAIPFAVCAGFDWVRWGRFLPLAAMAVGVSTLFLFGYLLQRKAPLATLAVPSLLLAVALLPGASHAAAGLLFYVCLLGPSEEILFRGMIQSRLNYAFGRPFRFAGARWGWGTVIACGLFALVHVVNLPAVFAFRWQPQWWSGPTIFCISLPLAYLRERTGGVLAPGLLHAWPQGLAYALRALW